MGSGRSVARHQIGTMGLWRSFKFAMSWYLCRVVDMYNFMQEAIDRAFSPVSHVMYSVLLFSRLSAILMFNNHLLSHTSQTQLQGLAPADE